MPDFNPFSNHKTSSISDQKLPILSLLLIFSLGLSGCQQTAATSKASSAETRVNSGQTNPKPGKNLNQVQNAETTDNVTLIVPGKSVGSITAQTTLADLQRLYGKDNVQAGQVPGPEGTTLPGAILFPKDASRKLTLYWKGASRPAVQGSLKHNDSKISPSNLSPNLKVESVIIDEPKSPWHTEEGIKVGTTLKELEQLNGHPFTMSGLDWDYGGLVLSWGDQGKLRDKFQKTGGLGLQLSAPAGYEGDYTAVMGDRTFSSDHPVLQKLNPQVSSISVFLQ